MMTLSDPVPLLLLLFSSLLLTLLAMPLVIRLAYRIGAVDKPDARKVHAKTMPRMGGLGFAIGLVVLPLSMVSSSLHPAALDLVGFILGLFVVVLSGMADDIIGISPKLKFIGLGIGSLLFVLITDTGIASMGDLFGLGIVETGWLAVPITVLAMVGFVNALNLSDGLDGLAAGISLIAAFFLGFFALKAGDTFSLALSVTLFGGMLGFLYFNSYPAKVFMGDTGSLTLGYVLAAISLLLIKYHGVENGFISPVIVGTLLALPLGDTLFVMGKRIREGESPFLPDKTHFHHRLMALGLPHSGVVGAIYALMMFYGIAAILLLQMPEWFQLIALLLLLGSTYALLHFAERAGVRIHIVKSLESRPGLAGNDNNSWPWLNSLMGSSVKYVTWLIPLLLVYPVLAIEVDVSLKLVAGLAILLAVILFSWQSKVSASWTNGLCYLLVFVPVLCINWYAGKPIQNFMLAATFLLCLWIVLKLVFRQHGTVLLATGLELILILLSWVGSWLVIELGLISDTMQPALMMACMQSIVFLLASKIVLNRQSHRNHHLFLSMVLLNCLLI